MKLGIEITEPTVAKDMVRHRKPPSQTWRTFLDNHVKTIVSVGRVEDWRHCPVGSAYPLLPVSVGSASVSEP